MTPLQAEVLEDARVPDPDLLGLALARPDLAPEAGYGEGGPLPRPGPGGPLGRVRRGSLRRPDTTGRPDATGEPGLTRVAGGDGGTPAQTPRVLQWEIDPRDERLPSGEAESGDGDWEYRLWWQEHPAGLVYASIHALREEPSEPGGPARAHPLGRNVAVNLVYDLGREAVVAIYGTARDFRPFVEAFREGYGLPATPTGGGPEVRAGCAPREEPTERDTPAEERCE